MTLRRAVALDLTLLFLDAAVLRFRDFAMEGVDIFQAPLVRGAGLDARTTPSPANRGASPWAALARPAHDDTNAYYAAEVQSVLRPEIRSHVLGAPSPRPRGMSLANPLWGAPG